MNPEDTPTTADGQPSRVDVRQVVEGADGTHQIRQDRTLREAMGDGETVAADVATTAAGKQVAVVVSHPTGVSPNLVPSGSTPTIRVGAYDDSGIAPVGVGNETLDVTVTRPDGNTESFTKTTDSSGQATIDYDVSQSGRGDGDYTIKVADPDGTASLSTNMTVGLNVVCTSVSFSSHGFTGEQSTYRFLAHDGDEPVSGVSLDLGVGPSGASSPDKTKSVTTNADGFASISYTPSSTGSYNVAAKRNGTTVAQEDFDVVDRLGRSDFALTKALKGATNDHAGYVETGSGPLANTDVVFELYEDFSKTTLVTSKTVTTDDAGFYHFQFDVPSDYGEPALYLQAETTDGDPVPLVNTRIDVLESASGGGGGGSVVNLSASTDYRYAPGDTVTVSVEATDDGNPIANQDVEVFLQYRYNGPPVYSTTVTTGSDGTASTSVSLPPDAPDGERLVGTHGMSYGGDTYTTDTFATIESLDIFFQVPKLTPGATETFSLDVTENGTDTAVQGVPLLFDARYDDDRAGSIDGALLRSGSDGTDQVSVSIPSDLGYEARANYLYRYRGLNTERILRTDHPGTLSTSDTVLAGDSTDFDFSASGASTVYGIAFGESSVGRTFATRFQGPGTFSLAIPAEFESGDTFDLTVWGKDGTGTLYRDESSFTVDGQASAPFLSERWRIDSGKRVQHVTPATDGSQVFGANLGPNVASVAPADGTTNWSAARAGDLSDSSPVVDSGTVYVGSGGGVLYALNASDGTQQWALSTDSAIVSSPTLVGSTVYVGANDGTVRAVSTSGTQQWATTLDGAVYSKPAVANGRVHVTTADGVLVTLDASDGSELWRTTTGVELGHTGALAAGGTVYLPADNLYALDASSGSESWAASFGGPSGSTPTLANSTVYVGSSDGSVYAVNTDGTAAWSTGVGGTVASDPAVSGGRVAVGSTDGTLYVLDADTGGQVGSTTLGAPTRGSPLVLNDDVYIGLRNGEVVSLANLSG